MRAIVATSAAPSLFQNLSLMNSFKLWESRSGVLHRKTKVLFNSTSDDKIGLKVHTRGNGGSGRSKESLLWGEGSQSRNSKEPGGRNPWGSVAHWFAFGFPGLLFQGNPFKKWQSRITESPTPHKVSALAYLQKLSRQARPERWLLSGFAMLKGWHRPAFAA